MEKTRYIHWLRLSNLSFSLYLSQSHFQTILYKVYNTEKMISMVEIKEYIAWKVNWPLEAYVGSRGEIHAWSNPFWFHWELGSCKTPMSFSSLPPPVLLAPSPFDPSLLLSSIQMSSPDSFGTLSHTSGHESWRSTTPSRSALPPL